MIKAKDINEKSAWQEMTAGGEIAEGGTSVLTMTGQWRSNRPVWEASKCKQCLLCAPFCPDSSIPVSETKRGDFDYYHCKGCGICWKICPFGAIDFVKEGSEESAEGGASESAEGTEAERPEGIAESAAAENGARAGVKAPAADKEGADS